ncbi:unnamed protein product [Candida verbasci]|uniref:Presequence protease, mitochondrial n=1 Tax=Candida verbasci TaxID=1227364 RepID=A0A9W4XGR5_9ASCO|nr:unnamed protein product [Candida verbasci]
MLKRASKINKTSYILSRFVSTISDVKKYPIGKHINGFEIKSTTSIPEFSLLAVQLNHLTTNAQHLHLDSIDNNNVFSIAFKTNPPDATGVPHILEHTTLCGSKKYPVRDPFFKMTNRSLSNFMNAMTGHDYTMYPFATTNANDFENLLDVYLSSVFEPNLNMTDFLQEGWRLENEDLTDKKTPLIFKGVVYNEMKGQYSNNAYYFYIKYLESIYPSLNNSGGDPTKITNLKHKDLVEFHNTNYHPSKAKSFTYGNLSLDKHLQALDNYYKRFNKIDSNSKINKPIFIDGETFYNVVQRGPIDTMRGKDVSEQFSSSITWNLGNPLSEQMNYEIFKWKILNSLLFDGHSSPLYQELIESRFSEDFSPNTGVDSHTALLSFTVGLNFLTKEKVDIVDEKITGVLKNVLKDMETNKSYDVRIKAILHQIELGFKKHKPDFGFGLISSITPSWVNGTNPIESLQVETVLNKFKQDYEKNGIKIFQDLIEYNLLNDQIQKFKFTMEPKADFSDTLHKIETENLNKKVEGLSESDKEEIYNCNLKLAEIQAQEENVDVLPTLAIEDINKKGEFYAINYNSVNEKLLHERIIDTNGLIYANALKDISYLPMKYYKYLPLFSSCLTNLAGTAESSIIDLETKIQRKTGGVSFNFKISTDPYNIQNSKLQYVLNGMALNSNSEEIYKLWYEILDKTRLEPDEDVVDKLFILIKNLGQNQANNIAERGHSFASSVSNSKLTTSKYISEITGGLTQVKFIMELNNKIDTEGKQFIKDELLPILREIRTLILSGNNFKYRLVGDSQSVKENKLFIEQFDTKIARGELPNSTDNLTSFSFNAHQDREFINLPFQVGYSSLAKLGSSYSSKEGAHLQILSQLYTFKNLHSKIREANGAYGGGLNYDGLNGLLNFYSYRDPNPVKSISTFINELNYGVNANWTDKDLQEAKLRIFQSLDAPINISSQGSIEFFDNVTTELKQERRENFLNTTIEDLKQVTEKYLVNPESINSITVIGNDEILKVEKSWNVKNLKIE